VLWPWCGITASRSEVDGENSLGYIGDFFHNAFFLRGVGMDPNVALGRTDSRTLTFMNFNQIDGFRGITPALDHLAPPAARMKVSA